MATVEKPPVTDLRRRPRAPSGAPPRRARELAADLGARYTVDPTSEDVAAEVMAVSDGVGAAQVLDFVGADETTALAPDVVAAGGDHHVVGYGGHVHEPAQALVDGEFSFVGNIVGRYAELQELVALVDRGDVDRHTTRYDLGEIDDVAGVLERNGDRRPGRDNALNLRDFANLAIQLVGGGPRVTAAVDGRPGRRPG